MASEYGDWEIVKQLGEGGQAHVYLVKHRTDQRVAVLKRLKNINRLERFKAEFKVMQDTEMQGKLFPQIYDANLEGKKPYFVMEYFPKGALNEELIKTWSLRDKAEFYISLAVAVAYANVKGVVHRDLKPGNVLVGEDNHARVTDFGICYLDEAGERQTLLDEAVGSFRFMAPEMEDGRADKVTQQTDVYCLGKLVYWLFSDGKTYNRERHREPQFNLAKDSAEPWRHHLNDFLDKVTNPDLDKRPKQTAEVIVEFAKVRMAIDGKVRYLDLAVNQTCAFCGIGTYRTAVNALDPNKGTSVSNFGFNPVGAPQWLILTCEVCGNVQSFRKDHAPKWGWKQDK